MNSPYKSLEKKLEDLLDVSAVAFPDGSVDTYFQVLEGKKNAVKSRKEVGKQVMEHRSSDFKLLPKRREPGGIAVNMGVQIDKLGADTKLFGHLDHPVLQDLDIPKESLGEPAKVWITEFEDGDILLARENQEILNWELSELEPVEVNLSADLICCGNWSSIPEMTEQLRKFHKKEIEGKVFNLDPGSIVKTEKESLRELFNVLGLINTSFEVIVHVNTEEMNAVANSLNIEGDKREKVNKVQEKADIEAFVLHEKPSAIAGTPEGLIEVKNLETSHVSTFSGGGDRFDAGFGLARSAGFTWEESLALGNICAVNYIESNRTAGISDIKTQLSRKDWKALDSKKPSSNE